MSRPFLVKIRARDEGIPMLESIVDMQVNVIDVDDRDPQFEHDTYEGVVNLVCYGCSAIYLHISNMHAKMLFFHQSFIFCRTTPLTFIQRRFVHSTVTLRSMHRLSIRCLEVKHILLIKCQQYSVLF